MSEQEETKSVSRGWWPPFMMKTKLLDFGLSEKTMHELNKVVYKAELQYFKDCADAERKMIDTIQIFMSRHKI